MDRKLQAHTNKNPFLGSYLKKMRRQTGMPRFYEECPEWGDVQEDFNIIYPITDLVYSHCFQGEDEKRYNSIEPPLDEKMKEKLKKAKKFIYREADYDREIEYREELREMINEIFDRLVGRGGGVFSKIKGPSLDIDDNEIPILKYYINRDLVEYGKLDPLLNDPNIEDINCVGTDPMTLIHKTFGRVKTNISFDDKMELEEYLKKISQRVGSPVGEAHPIVDTAMPDGSRINIVYPEDVSTKGRSFTIRKFPDDPIAITNLIEWNTMSAELAAYLWLCLENSMSIFICGETASGKTTTLNACLPFIHLDSKIYSVEDTPEVQPPHDNWQQLIVREEGPEEEQVGMFDLLKAALRSRPDYIVPSEIRGEEGRVAFQGMQTGHPVISTFHADSIHRMIQRLTGEPIKIPITFIDNLNVPVVQDSFRTEGAVLRRVTEVGEIMGYSEEQDGVMMRVTFQRNHEKDQLEFEGMYNSYILEDKIAKIQGYDDTRKIYDVMEERAEFLEDLVRKRIYDYDKVAQLIDEYRKGGRENLSIRL